MKFVLVFFTIFLLHSILPAQVLDLQKAIDRLPPNTSRADSSNLSLHLNTDCWPEENTWSITNVEGEIVHEGGPYFAQSLTQITEEFWLETGTYTFTFYDAAGDGLYATQWGGLCDENGSFELMDAAGNVILEYDGTSNFDSLSVNFDFNAAVNVPEYSPVQSVRTYPNPFRDRVWLEVNLQQSERIIMEVYSTDGRLQHRTDATQLPAGSSNLELGLENLVAGPYLIRITAGGQSIIQHIIKLQ